MTKGNEERELLRAMWEAWSGGEDGDDVFAKYGGRIKVVLARGEKEIKKCPTQI
jgi:hypothetical protein